MVSNFGQHTNVSFFLVCDHVGLDVKQELVNKYLMFEVAWLNAIGDQGEYLCRQDRRKLIAQAREMQEMGSSL